MFSQFHVSLMREEAVALFSPAPDDEVMLFLSKESLPNVTSESAHIRC